MTEQEAGQGQLARTFLFLRYLLAQVLEELRFLLLKPLAYACPPKHRALLLSLRKNGYAVIKGVYTQAEIASINSEVEREIRPLLSDSYPGLSKLPGSIRFRRPETRSFLFKSLTREIYWIAIHALYNGKIQAPVLMLSFTEEINTDYGASSPVSKPQFFADHPHFDSYKHELKVVVALTDVDEYAGATEIAISTSHYHLKYWREYFSSWMATKEILDTKTKTISSDFYQHSSRLEKILLSAGDVAIFDSRNLHRATPLVRGRRDLLWYYF